MKTEDWEDLLRTYFCNPGIEGVKWAEICRNQESIISDSIYKGYRGHNLISESFLEFMNETIVQCKDQVVNVTLNDTSWYSPFFGMYTTALRFRRASDILFFSAYPLPAHALQRTILDISLCLGAVGNSYVKIPELFGLMVENGQVRAPTDMNDIFRIRERNERRAISLMTGPDSNLEEGIRSDLRKWKSQFHREVHGAQNSWLAEMKTLTSSQPFFRIGPAVDEMADAIFMNRWAETSWLLNRCLPLLQMEPSSFGSDWAQKWLVMDQCLEHYVMSLLKIGKPIVKSIKALVDEKFAFNPEITLEW